MNSPAAVTLGAITFRDRPFPDVVRAAQGAGFEAIGLTVGQCVSALERGVGLGEILPALRAAGLRVGELELFRLCPDPGVAHLNEALLELVPLLEPDRIHTAAFSGDPASIQDSFTALCRRLPSTTVAIEFMPYSAVATLDEALEIVARSGAPNARVVLDVVHFFRSGATVERLTNDVLDVVACVQLSDVVRRPRSSLTHEARHQRVFPGDGTLDIEGLLRRVHEVAGAFPPISVEPISDALEQMPLDWVADRAMVSTVRMTDRALQGATSRA